MGEDTRTWRQGRNPGLRRETAMNSVTHIDGVIVIEFNEADGLAHWLSALSAQEPVLQLIPKE